MMKCTIPGNNIRIFGKSVHTLSSIGEELYLEPMEHGLALRTVNSSRSAYACFIFTPTFFQHYDDGSGQIRSQDSEEETVKCKINMKSCLSVFKSLSTLEKTVERCKIDMNMDEARIVFQMHCKHGIVKTHNIAFIECETLQAVFSKDVCTNIIIAQSRLLSDAVLNFQNNQEEVTLIAGTDRVSLKNYVDDEPDPNKVMHTELNLDPDEFDRCDVSDPVEITFCLKELRAILNFAEGTSLPLSMHFDTPGRPVIFSLSCDKSFEGNFVLATLADLSTQKSCSQLSQNRTSNKSQYNDSNNRTITNVTTTTRKADVPQPPSFHNKQSHDRAKRSLPTEKFDAAYQELMNDDMDMVLNDIANEEMDGRQTANQKGDNRLAANQQIGVNQQINHRSTNNHEKGYRTNQYIDTGLAASSASGDSVASHGSRTRQYVETLSQEDGTDKHDCSPVIPNQATVSGDISHIQAIYVPEDEDEEECVPGTPPSKKFKSLFFGLSQSSTQQTTQPPSSGMSVLAEDTDSDDD